MKQTPVEWFWDKIAEILPFTVDTETGMALYMAYQKAKEMEAEQSPKEIFLDGNGEPPTISKMETIRKNGIVELSDEEIKEIAKQHLGDRSATNIYYWLIEGMQLYREQLKQRQ